MARANRQGSAGAKDRLSGPGNLAQKRWRKNAGAKTLDSQGQRRENQSD
jgi:hypothetical protein